LGNLLKIPHFLAFIWNIAMKTSTLEFRWLIRRDVKHVLPMINISAGDLVALLRQRNCIGLVLEDQQTMQIVGVVIYMLHKQEIDIVFFGHNHNFTDSFFPAMVERMTDKLSQQRRTRLHVNVPEHDVCSQIRLSEFGFLGSQVDDVVVMSYYLHAQAEFDDGQYGYC
jgi:hypothetical protein